MTCTKFPTNKSEVINFFMTFSQILKCHIVIETYKSNINEFFLKKKDNSMIENERFEPYMSLFICKVVNEPSLS